ncbi:MAG: hypothetical protein R3E39_16405 [Anaerolineae bacterium]
MEKNKNDDLYFAHRSGVGRPIVGVVLILIGIAFLLIYGGVFSPHTIGEFFGNFGSSMGEFFGNFGQSVGEFFGNFGQSIGTFFGDFGAMIGRLWPLLLIVLGLGLLFFRRKPTVQ